LIYSLNNSQNQIYQLNEEKYCQINDLILDSKGCVEGKFNCVLACKVAHMNQV